MWFPLKFPGKHKVKGEIKLQIHWLTIEELAAEDEQNTYQDVTLKKNLNNYFLGLYLDNVSGLGTVSVQ